MPHSPTEPEPNLPDPPGWDIHGMPNGTVFVSHAPDKCAGDRCCLHNPGDHPLRTAPLFWRADRRIMERICTHGIGHPDPDDLRTRASEWESVHGCDGCCSPTGGGR